VTALRRQLESALPLRRTARLWLTAAVVIWVSACFNTSAPANKGGLKSFLGIDFGTSLKDTRTYYPKGLTEKG
jgi:hypothetical protein